MHRDTTTTTIVAAADGLTRKLKRRRGGSTIDSPRRDPVDTDQTAGRYDRRRRARRHKASTARADLGDTGDDLLNASGDDDTGAGLRVDAAAEGVNRLGRPRVVQQEQNVPPRRGALEAVGHRISAGQHLPVHPANRHTVRKERSERYRGSGALHTTGRRSKRPPTLATASYQHTHDTKKDATAQSVDSFWRTHLSSLNCECSERCKSRISGVCNGRYQRARTTDSNNWMPDSESNAAKPRA